MREPSVPEIPYAQATVLDADAYEDKREAVASAVFGIGYAGLHEVVKAGYRDIADDVLAALGVLRA